MKWWIAALLLLPACATKKPVPSVANTDSYADGFIQGNAMAECPPVECDFSDLKRANQDLDRRLQECLEAGSNDK